MGPCTFQDCGYLYRAQPTSAYCSCTHAQAIAESQNEVLPCETSAYLTSSIMELTDPVPRLSSSKLWPLRHWLFQPQFQRKRVVLLQMLPSPISATTEPIFLKFLSG